MRKGRAGFAVMELLVAMALLAVIASFVAGSLAFGNRVWERAQSVSDNGLRLSQIAFVRQTLSQARSPTGPRSSNITLEGRRDGIGLTVLRPTQGYPADQPWRVSFARMPRTDYLTVGFSPQFVGGAAVEEREILHDLRTFSMRYYGRLLDEDQPGWHQDWEDQPHLPDLIEISLTFSDMDGVEPQRVTIRPKAY